MISLIDFFYTEGSVITPVEDRKHRTILRHHCNESILDSHPLLLLRRGAHAVRRQTYTTYHDLLQLAGSAHHSMDVIRRLVIEKAILKLITAPEP